MLRRRTPRWGGIGAPGAPAAPGQTRVKIGSPAGGLRVPVPRRPGRGWFLPHGQLDSRAPFRHCVSGPGLGSAAWPAEARTGMPAGVPAVIPARSVEGEAASLPPGYLTPLPVAVPIAGRALSRQRCARQRSPGWRVIPHRRESRVSRCSQGPHRRRVPCSSLPVAEGRPSTLQPLTGRGSGAVQSHTVNLWPARRAGSRHPTRAESQVARLTLGHSDFRVA